MRQMKWFDRRFTFDESVGIFAGVVERLRGTPASPAELLERFRGERDAIVARLEALSDEEVRRSSLHPRLRVPMRALDLALFVAEHDDHHLARIGERLRSR